MKLLLKFLFYMSIFSGTVFELSAQSDSAFKIFQFPPDKIPGIDGNTEDWEIVPESYCIGSEHLIDDERIHVQPDSGNLDVKVRVGWVKGLNRLYFLYEAYDNYWDFSRTDLHQDIFEVVVDGDKSGGPFIEQFHPERDNLGKWELYFSFHGVHAQNYHIFTPADGKDWCMFWGSQQWLKKLPYANSAYSYNFNPGDSGKLVLEFWITPFDSAYSEGPSSSLESSLTENEEIGLSWAIIDFDDVNADRNNGFWNLSDHHTMYGNASYLRAFRLMPLEEKFRNKLRAEWLFKVIDMDRKMVAFQDLSEGEITSWKWDFGDGTVSTDQHPMHTYETAGLYVVALYIEGPAGKSRMAKVWDVAIR